MSWIAPKGLCSGRAHLCSVSRCPLREEGHGGKAIPPKVLLRRRSSRT